MLYDLKITGDEVKIYLSSEINVTIFKEIIEKLKNHENIKVVKLDLSRVEYIQSKVLAGFIQLNKYCVENGIEFFIVNANETILQLFELTNLSSVFKVDVDFSSYNPEELISFFEDVELADKLSDYISENYNDEFKTLMKKLIKSDDPILKEYAILTVGKAGDLDFLDEVRSALNDDVGNVIKAAITVLGWFQDFESKEKIYEFLESEFIDVAESAAATIALLSDENDADRLKELLNSQDERLRKIAIQALTLINDDKSYEILKEELEKENNDYLLAYILKMLSFFRKEEVSDIIFKYLSHPSNIVRETAASSLVRINAVDKVDDILKLVNDSDSMVAYFAVKAIGELCKSENCVETLISVYHTVPENVKLAIVEALGKIGIDVSDFLYQCLSEKNEDLRKEALNSLFLLQADNLRDIAEECLKDKSWLVRYKAVEVLSQIRDNDIETVLRLHLENEDNKFVKEKIYQVLGEL
ncbi:HEAT repeat domain-containing protein [Deferribacter thermophilus]|uniref:HEAT repeat domain-containing protein n=1 Tax=Deferribacter thermophilus TaxID=53573 RepID=UPI003C22E62A